jgi:hypothetical protein
MGCLNSVLSKTTCSILTICLILAAVFSSCTHNALYEAQLKSLDSLGGALNQKLTELKQVDTVILKKAITKYNNYRQFIQQNVNDTVNKEEANHLQQFYVSGKALADFSINRTTILARGSLLNSQIGKLVTDIKERAVPEEKLQQYASAEKQQAQDLMKASYEQQQSFQASLQEFKLSLMGVESLIKSRNNGQMPVIIKDSIPL